MSRTLALTLIFSAALAVAGCSGDQAPTDGSERSGLAGLADKAAKEIRDEIANEDMILGRGANGEPTATLSPQGELVIDGETVALDPDQRAIALAYRQALGDVAQAGASVGLQGAALAGDAMKLAAASVLSGEADTVKEQLKEKTDAIEAEAMALCGLLPNLLEQQRRFAAAVPEFVPYANMDESDIDDCRAKSH